MTMVDLCQVATDLGRITVEIRDGDCSLGAGVLWPTGHVVTNAHVARRPRLAVGFADGRQFEGHLLARDESVDLALLSIAGQEPRPATPLDATLPRIGSLVIAVGHPFGVRRAATVGIVHAFGPLGPGGRNWIQADLRLAPGNSGGPIADAAGRVVGLSTMVMNTLGLAVPVSEVERFVRRAGPG